jgi:hypothetical protein
MVDKLEQWNNMEVSEKIKYNGYNGFLKGETWQETSLFKNCYVRRCRDE